jgi:hypothetical protein
MAIYGSNFNYGDSPLYKDEASIVLLVDFIADSRVGYAPFTVVFTNLSTIPNVVSNTWDFGDGTIYEGTETTTISYTYEEPGIYTVSLTVYDGLTHTSEVKEGYIAVNYAVVTPSMVIAKSDNNAGSKYWNFYIDLEGYLVFENEQIIHRSESKVVDVASWTFVQYNPGSNKMFAGDKDNFIREIRVVTRQNNSPEIPTRKGLFVLKNSTLSVDTLRIWYGEKDLTDYFNTLWGRSALLSQL